MDGSNQQTQALALRFTLEVVQDSEVLPPILRAGYAPVAEAVVPPDATTLMATLTEALMAALKAQGYAEYHLDDPAMHSFIQQCAQANGPVTADIGERRSAAFSLDVSEDLMSVWLTLSPAQGGSAIGIQVQDELRDREITHGILHSDLNAALSSGWCDRLLIVQGEPPLPGTPGRFEALFGLEDKVAHGSNENAKVKFRDLSHLLLVHANDPLMRIFPPLQGKNGKNIKGQIVLAPPMPDIQFGSALQGSAQDKNDPTLLVAMHAGQPVEVSDGVVVNPVITVKHVDLSTGTIQFEGTLHVEGDIKTGMQVNVTGDVIVNGMIESAEVNAGGNVAVKGGVIGRAGKKAGTQQLDDTAARLRCGGSAQALFMENVHVEAGNSILIDQNARDCELIARDEIIVGKAGSRAGQIIGGRAQATMLIKTEIAGTNVATKTRLQVGVDPYLEEQIVKKQDIIKRKVADLDQVLKLIVYFERNPQKNIDGVAQKVEAKRVQQLKEIDQLTAELAELEAQLNLIEKACLKIGKTIHDGVEIQIGKQSWQVREERSGGTYRLKDGEIVLV